METFTPPPYKEKRPQGRQPKYTLETRLTIGRKLVEKEMTYKDAAKVYNISEGCVGVCVRLFKDTLKKEHVKTKKNDRIDVRKREIRNYHHQNQIRELKQQIGDLYLENQILKKILKGSQQIKNDNGSIITTENLDQYQEDVR